jgi:hypothetical protein
MRWVFEYLKPENISSDGKVASPQRKTEALYAKVHSGLNVSHTASNIIASEINLYRATPGDRYLEKAQKSDIGLPEQ